MQKLAERLHRLQADFCSWVSPCRFFWEFAGASDPLEFFRNSAIATHG